MPLYGALTGGKSIPFSKKLIRYEKWALWGAWYFDWVGDRYQKKGIPYMKAEFVEMSLTPEFSNNYPEEIDYSVPLQPVKLNSFSYELKGLIRKKDFEGLVSVCEEYLELLDQQPHVYCMLRHVVESLCRIAYLVPIHQSKCEQIEMKTPFAYSLFLIKTHRWALKASKELDEAASFIQIAGVPFLFQDLPKIDLEIAAYD